MVMAQILVRNLEPEVVERLKEQARNNGRSLQAEVAQILREASHRRAMADARAIADKWKAYWGDRIFSDSAELIREDRER
jgi:plasmid stability protein